MNSTKIIRFLCLFVVIIFSRVTPAFTSFLGTTLIATSHGLVLIEKLKVGDKVLSYNYDATKPEESLIEVAITKIDKHSTDSLFFMYTAEGACVSASPQQLFFALKNNQSSCGQSSNISAASFVQAQYITTEHLLVDVDMDSIPVLYTRKICTEKTKRDKHKNITCIEKQMITIEVYSLEVEAPHVFFVAIDQDFNTNEPPCLLLTHNGLPVLSAGLSLAFGSTPASLSFAEAVASAGGIGAAFGPAGLAVGVVTGLGLLGFSLYKNKHKNQSCEYIECAGGGNHGGIDPKEPKDKNDEKNTVKNQSFDNKGKYPRDHQTSSTKQQKAIFQSEREARAMAREKMGKNPVEIGDNKLRSQDGKWQYRAKENDVTGKHAGAPHIHLEELNPETGEVLENWHFFWK